jgi:hypothetical protein
MTAVAVAVAVAAVTDRVCKQLQLGHRRSKRSIEETPSERDGLCTIYIRLVVGFGARSLSKRFISFRKQGEIVRNSSSTTLS